MQLHINDENVSNKKAVRFRIKHSIHIAAVIVLMRKLREYQIKNIT